MIKFICSILILLTSISIVKSQNVEYIEELLPYNDNSIIYPVFKNISGAENINKTFLNTLEKSFNLDGCGDLENTIELAINKGLDSLRYVLFETDTTVSLSVAISLKKGKTLYGWTDYYTFSKRTGKQLYIDDLFPERDMGLLQASLLRLQIKNIQFVRANLIKKYNEGIISQKEYSVLLYLIDKHMLASFNSDDFLLSSEYIIFKNGIILPTELAKHIPDFFRVQLSELLLDY